MEADILDALRDIAVNHEQNSRKGVVAVLAAGDSNAP
jgi:hypothetical protein